MGTNDSRILSKKYYETANEYYKAGLMTSNLTNRYKYWNIGKLYFEIAKNFAKLEEKGVENGK